MVSDFRSGLTFALLCLFTAVAPAQAGTLEEARALYGSGDYDQAVEVASSLGTADGYGLAARSLLGKVNLQSRKERKMSDINQAIDLSKKALELEPDHLEGHLQLASSYGIKGRAISMFRAQMAGLPEKSLFHLTKGTEIKPESGWCWAFVGAWHLEIVRNAGPGVGRTLYGATTKEGIEAFDHSLTLDPDNPTLPFQYALILLTIDPYGNKSRGIDLLQQTTAIQVVDHQDIATVARAETLLKAVKQDSIKEVMKLLADYQGLKPLRVPRKRK
jgi:tetratricopeptide (TPR) repeat protein